MQGGTNIVQKLLAAAPPNEVYWSSVYRSVYSIYREDEVGEPGKLGMVALPDSSAYRCLATPIECRTDLSKIPLALRARLPLEAVWPVTVATMDRKIVYSKIGGSAVFEVDRVELGGPTGE